MRLFLNASYDFIGWRRIAYVGSGSLILIGILTAVFWQISKGSWLNYGVDFTGGTLVQVQFKQPTTAGQLRGVLQAVAPGTEVTRFGKTDEYLIRAPQFTEGTSNVGDAIVDAMKAKYGADNFVVEQREAVGPKIGNELQQKALLAILLSFGFTLVYLAFRFEWRFGLAAIIATFHDIILTLSLIAGFQLDVSLTTVAAVLTIIGYSLNDTIIVFDRIRENLRATGRREDTKSILNLSINETLPRTTLTAGTTVATLLALFVLGGEVIRQFALILIIGIVFGTYSSIFIASPALLEIEKRWGMRNKKSRGRRSRPARAGAGV
jgi:preprotein translocase subunit SecF